MDAQNAEPQLNESILPATPSDVIRVIQFKYYQMLNLHESFLRTFLDGKLDLRLSRQVFTNMVTVVLLIKNYDVIKKDKVITKALNFIEAFAKSRYDAKIKDIDPKILFDLVQVLNDAYNKLGLADLGAGYG